MVCYAELLSWPQRYPTSVTAIIDRAGREGRRRRSRAAGSVSESIWVCVPKVGSKCQNGVHAALEVVLPFLGQERFGKTRLSR